jgi:hypothetical protein
MKRLGSTFAAVAVLVLLTGFMSGCPTTNTPAVEENTLDTASLIHIVDQNLEDAGYFFKVKYFDVGDDGDSDWVFEDIYGRMGQDITADIPSLGAVTGAVLAAESYSRQKADRIFVVAGSIVYFANISDAQRCKDLMDSGYSDSTAAACFLDAWNYVDVEEFNFG